MVLLLFTAVLNWRIRSRKGKVDMNVCVMCADNAQHAKRYEQVKHEVKVGRRFTSFLFFIPSSTYCRHEASRYVDKQQTTNGSVKHGKVHMHKIMHTFLCKYIFMHTVKKCRGTFM